jgi:hypothetical protein
MSIERYCHNHGLFDGAYFRRFGRDSSLPGGWALPPDAAERLRLLRDRWESLRLRYVLDLRAEKRLRRWEYTGLPPHLEPLHNPESNVEQEWVRFVVETVLGYTVDNNRTLELQGEAAREAAGGRQRPDMTLFASQGALAAVVQRFGNRGAEAQARGAPNGADFCRDAAFVLDAKRFEKGVGADEEEEAQTPKQQRSTALKDIQQVERYLRGYDKTWGILTNGRSWRLLRRGSEFEHLRFDLVLLLEHLRAGEIGEAEALAGFGFFWHLFGIPAVAGGFLDRLARESEASYRKVRDVLGQNALNAVEEIARGFWAHPDNGFPPTPSQADLDRLRELSLTLLYRLLFVLKAEAQGLLPMRDRFGAATPYANQISTQALFVLLAKQGAAERSGGMVYGAFAKAVLFRAINEGSKSLSIPPYNGGLFDPERHPDLERLALPDESLHRVLRHLIYLEGEEAVPYADLDVRDLGDIYEGLLEQRLVPAPEIEPPTPPIKVVNQKGERKASGSYFTIDVLVDHLVRKALMPLLEGCGHDPHKILGLRVLDLSMGSGHFLVKVVDVIASYLTVHCDPVDPVEPWERDNGPREMAYWRSKVAENCIYGVDYNPMAVELAKVALWLHTARPDRPLSFIDHHLKVGNSLVGASMDQLATPGLKALARKAGVLWEPVFAVDPPQAAGAGGKRKGRQAVASGQLELPLRLDQSLITAVVRSIHAILDQPSDRAEDVKRKGKEYAEAVQGRLAAHRALADLWCAQWFVVDPDAEGIGTYEHSDGLFARLKDACRIGDDSQRLAAFAALADHPVLAAVRAARAEGYGPRPLAFFHWQLEFPEVAFDEQGNPRPGFGFHAVVGNPPWDKIKPAKRDFYGPFSPEVANTQGPSLDALIGRLEAAHPELAPGWQQYERRLEAFVRYLAKSGLYRHQTALVDGARTGGDPDLFRYCVERAFQCAGSGGRVAFVVPAALWQAEGCTALRRLLLETTTVECLHVFENYRKWAFAIDSRFKFTTFVATSAAPPAGHTFPAGFMLRDTRILDGLAPEREVRLSRDTVRLLSPETLALLDFRCDADAQLVARLHREHPALGSARSGWDVRYRCELHMTNDSWLFRQPEWMRQRGFTRIRPLRGDDGVWRQEGETACPTRDHLPEPLPAGGEYWVAAAAKYYRDRGYAEKQVTLSPDAAETVCFIHPEDLRRVDGRRFEERHFRILPRAVYTPLYEGRMVHNLDHAKKAYVSGEGRRAIWAELPVDAKALAARAFVNLAEARIAGGSRLGFCDITGATNERSMLAALLPSGCAAGNKVPALAPREASPVPLAGLLSSFVWDYLVRLRISTTLNWTYVASCPTPTPGSIPAAVSRELAECVCRLSCTTPELADYWNAVFPDQPWTYDSAERDPWTRAELRAEIDAIAAELYGLSVPEYARVLSGFPLLDRDQPPLPGDCFLTEGDETVKARPGWQRGVNWAEVQGACFELKPRSFITRDLALLTYARRQGYPIPADLECWYRDAVGLDPCGPLSRFRIGEVKDLETRVVRARELGAVAYVPTARGVAEAEEEGGAAATG